MTHLIKVSLNDGWMGNKPTRRKDGPGLEHNGKYVDTSVGWRNVEMSYEDIFKALTEQGQSICARLKGSKRADNQFVSNNLILIDIDHGLTIEKAQQHYLYTYCAGFYASPSYRPEAHFFRLLFRLEESITSADDIHYLYTGLIMELGGDRACKEPSRFFYGNPTDIKECQTDVVLPKAMVKLLIAYGRTFEPDKPEHKDREPDKPLSKEHKAYFLAKLKSTFLGNYYDWYRLGVAMKGAGFSVEEYVEMTRVVMSQKSEEEAEEQWSRIERDPKHNISWGFAINLLKAKGVDMADMPKQDRAREAIVICYADIKEEHINWLWPKRIARGNFTLVFGDTDAGKSHVMSSLMGIITKGGTWPVTNERCERGAVIHIDTENYGPTIEKPRLRAEGADVSLCHRMRMVRTKDTRGNIILDQLDMLQDIGTLEDTITRIGNVSLIVIDPITDYLGKTDANSNSEVRYVLGHIQAVAERHNVAIIGINHTNKNENLSASNRAMGSAAFRTASRASFIVSESKEVKGRRLLTTDKGNLSPLKNGFAFKIEHIPKNGDMPETTCVSWEKEFDNTTADEALAPKPRDKKETNVEGRPAYAMEAAVRVLNDALSHGPVLVADMKEKVENLEISWKTMLRAKEKLSLGTEKISGKDCWIEYPI